MLRALWAKSQLFVVRVELHLALLASLERSFLGLRALVRGIVPRTEARPRWMCKGMSTC